MARHWRIYRAFLASALRRELEFKANFFAKIFQNLSWMFFFILTVVVIYSHTDLVAGWNQGEALVLTGTLMLMTSVAYALFPSLMEIPEQVRRGSLDFVLTKPIDSQFWVSLRRFNFDQIGGLIGATIIVCVSVGMSGKVPVLADVFGFIVLTGVAVGLVYSMNLMLMTLGIWFVRVDNLWVLGETVTWVARYPLDVYGPSLRRLFTYAAPFGFLSYFPAAQLVKGFDLSMVLLGLTWLVVGLVLSRMMWRFAQKSYSSASS